MARPGVTFSEVANAAAELAGQNRNPTIEQIRLITGRGSSTTLATHLRRWKAEQAGDSLHVSLRFATYMVPTLLQRGRIMKLFTGESC